MNKRNNKKEKIADALSEAIVEIILTIVFFAIGFAVCIGIGKIFSIKTNNFDLDSFVLIGIAFLALMILVVNVIKTIVMKLKDKKFIKSMSDSCNHR